MKKQIRHGLMASLTVLLALVLLLPAGCATVRASDLMTGVKAAEWPAQPAEPSTDFRTALSSFSWNLLQQSAKNKGNILISPASVFLALAMTLNGADTTTRSAMLTALAAGNLTLEQVNTASRDWMTVLMQTKQNTRLTIANSIWYRKGFQPDPAFLQRNADYFNAAARSLDFGSKTAPDTINGWVKSATNNLIDKMIDQIDPQVVMYLINAVYFKAEWLTAFDAKDTLARTFKAPDGEKSVKFMNRTGQMEYLTVQGGQGVRLPYKDGRYAFVAVLPDESTSPRDLAGSLTAAGWDAMLKAGQAVKISLSLPKYEVRYEDSLVNELKNLGMTVAFDPGQADFSLMNADRAKNLFISEVKHKTFCRVDELGTEAAAATSVEMRVTGMPVSDKTLIFDRPFLYGIVDTNTGLPLFLGILENPAA